MEDAGHSQGMGLVVWAEDPSAEGQEQARRLATSLKLPWIRAAHEILPGTRLILAVATTGLEVWAVGTRLSPLRVDLEAGATGYRRQTVAARKDPLARAVGVKGTGLTVVDATAGLGRDAFLLACRGCMITAVERHPVLHALLADGLLRATLSPDRELAAVVARIHLVADDTRRFLATMSDSQHPQVVYLDPMFPPQKKTALASREIRICRMLAGDDEDAGELLTTARAAARQRVVVKRHRLAPPLEPEPDFCITGRSVRYDVYMTRGGA